MPNALCLVALRYAPCGNQSPIRHAAINPQSAFVFPVSCELLMSSNLKPLTSGCQPVPSVVAGLSPEMAGSTLPD
jgi:hypothetical protein